MHGLAALMVVYPTSIHVYSKTFLASVLMDFTVMQHLERYVEQDTPFKIT